MDSTPDTPRPAPGVDAASDAAPPADEPRAAGGMDAGGDSLLDAAPALARMTLNAWWNTAAWALGSSLRLADNVARAAFSLGDADHVPTREDVAAAVRREEEVTLRERGAELLRRSADVHFDDDSHPAYVRILEELAPDEARIIRLLATTGPQASVDVRGGLPFASSLVAPGLTMIGSEAGCRHPERVHPYLNNLNRLGLVWFSRETLEDPTPYQVLEAQPEVVEALEQAGRLGRTVRRSIHLTPFGADFCRAALPSDTLEFEAVVDTHSAADPAEVSAEPERDTPLDPVPPSPPPGGADGATVGAEVDSRERGR
jgi:hypothetical protein